MYIILILIVVIICIVTLVVVNGNNKNQKNIIEKKSEHFNGIGKSTNINNHYNLVNTGNGNQWNLKGNGNMNVFGVNNFLGGITSSDCYKLDNSTCLRFSNCGVAIKNSEAKCVPADIQGPLFENSEKFIYHDYDGKHIFNESEITVSRPITYFYNDYDAYQVGLQNGGILSRFSN